MKEEKREIYLDNAATTQLSNEVYLEMLDCFQNNFGNASSLHSFGRKALNAVEIARERIAKAINASPSEIYFTSGGTESDNWAIEGIAKANIAKGNHIIVSAIEHPAILETCARLEKEGFVVTYIPVDKFGTVKYVEIVKAVGPKTTLISIMTANNEIGTIQPIQAIAEYAHANGVIFHTDAVQAIGAVEIDVAKMGIDSLSMSAHKIHGPKGVGILFVKKGIKILPFMKGGHQEKAMRAGTHNTPGIVGMGKAVEIAVRDLEKNVKILKDIKRYFLREVLEKIPNVSLNGHPTQRLPGNANLTFEGIEGESILMMLDLAGIAVSTGSACASGSLEPSHVLQAIGIDDEVAHSSIRFTFGTEITQADVDYVVENLARAVKNLRKISPMKIKKTKKE